MKIHIGDFIKKTGAEISLSEAERAKMRRVVSEYMAMKPMRGADANRAPAQRVRAWYVFLQKPVAFALIAVLLVSVSGAGISYAAEGALPGDILYPVKVGINEPVEAAFAVTSEAKAAVAVKRAVARLNEASALAAKGKLTPATEETLASAFETQADTASKHVSELETNDSPAAIAVASDVESELAAHVEVLDEVSPQAARTLRTVALAKARVFSGIRASAEGENDVSRSAGPAVAVAAKVAAPMAFTAQHSEASSSSDESGTPPALPFGTGRQAALRMGTAAKETLSEADALFVKLSVKLSADEVAQATSTISAARSGIADADAEAASGSYIPAFHGYQDSLVSLKKLEVFMKVSIRDSIRIAPAPLPDRGRVDGGDVSSGAVKDSSGEGHGSGSDSHSGSGSGPEGNTPPPTLQILPLGDD